MSILIKGMEMPSIDLEWRIIRGQDGKWYAIDDNAETSDGEWHEIVPIPAHGRLIDADALAEQAITEWFCGNPRVNVPWRAVSDAPTIIQAEEGE